jgi:hypothetical protein
LCFVAIEVVLLIVCILLGGTLYALLNTFGHGFVDTSITESVTESLRIWRSGYGFGDKEHGHCEASQNRSCDQVSVEI